MMREVKEFKKFLRSVGAQALRGVSLRLEVLRKRSGRSATIGDAIPADAPTRSLCQSKKAERKTILLRAKSAA